MAGATYRKLACRLVVIGVISAAVVACQELPTEPTPIDLSKDQPVATDDQVTVPEESLVRIDVLANDSSLVDDALSITEIVTAPRFGEAAIDGDVITYLPVADYNGSDSLRYKVSGSVLSSTAKVLITVTPVNDPPVAVDDSYTIDESIAIPKAQLATLDVLANDTDIDGDALRIIRTSTPENGSVMIASDGSSLSFDPTTNFSGAVQFTYTISDGNGGQDLATVVVTVRPINDVPVALNDQYATSEDVVRDVDAPGVLANDVDPESDPLTAVLLSDVVHGALSLMPDGSFTYEPDADYFGTDRFAYAASDGIVQSLPAQVNLTVLPVNDSPVAVSDSYGTDEDLAIVIVAPGVLANDYDIDGDALNLTLVAGTMHGQLELRSNGSFTYTPDAAFSGGDGFEYQIDDGTLASQATVSISVGSVNDTPVANPDQYDVAANLDLAVTAPGVLENDSDEDGDPLVAVLAGSPNGSLVLETDGSFAYSPPPGFSGTDVFTYRASDGSSLSDPASVVILVTAIGRPPEAVDDAYSVPVSDTLEVADPGILENDSDGDDDPITAVLVDDVTVGSLELNAGGGFIYYPPEDFTGPVTFTYRARDGVNVSGLAQVTITVGG